MIFCILFAMTFSLVHVQMLCRNNVIISTMIVLIISTHSPKEHVCHFTNFTDFIILTHAHVHYNGLLINCCNYFVLN